MSANLRVKKAIQVAAFRMLPPLGTKVAQEMKKEPESLEKYASGFYFFAYLFLI